ncbi:MAG: hypothetical protein II689_02300, partial [Firmicutes bacterium]|nr:hypothetical protein [Bacillota bacterium]
KGRWPGKPPAQETAPTTEQVRSLLTLFTEDDGSSELVTATHLGIVETKNGRMVIPGNGAESVRSKADALGVTVLTIFSAGSDGFKASTIEGVTTWNLRNRTPDTVISLLENGALVATPGLHTNLDPDIIVRDDGDVTVTLQSVKLHTPKYTIYQPHGTDDVLTLEILDSSESMAFTIGFLGDQVTNNDAVFSVPSFSGSEFRLDSVSPLRDKCAVRYGGILSFSTPFADFGNLEITQLQLKYGDSVVLDGIECDGSVEVPSIAGFPVSGGAEMRLNTFAPHRLISLSVELETPIFSGAFETSFKEVRGVIMLDTLYAELAVDEGGIPLVPPTVIGYLQGGGLGISGLADTVAMDSFGAPPVRLNVAAKGSIVDVIEGWVRLSVGMDGFDLSMTDIEIADMKFIKEFGISAKWDAGDREIKGKTYWGLSADMEQYMVIAVPATVGSFYGGEDDDLPLLFSATGTIGYGCFTGYYEEDGWIYFIYQLHASGSLKGSITIPKKLVGGVFPFQSINLGNAEIGFYTSAAATSKVNSSKVSGSPTNVLRQLASNTKLHFDAAVGAKLVVGTGAFRFYVRAVYVLGEKAPRLSAGYGDGGELDLSALSNKAAAKGRSFAMVGTLEDPETGETVPAVVEMAAENLASMQMSGEGQGAVLFGEEEDPGVTLIRTRAGNSFSAEVTGAVVGNTFLAITLSDADRTLNINELSV